MSALRHDRRETAPTLFPEVVWRRLPWLGPPERVDTSPHRQRSCTTTLQSHFPPPSPLPATRRRSHQRAPLIHLPTAVKPSRAAPSAAALKDCSSSSSLGKLIVAASWARPHGSRLHTNRKILGAALVQCACFRRSRPWLATSHSMSDADQAGYSADGVRARSLACSSCSVRPCSTLRRCAVHRAKCHPAVLAWAADDGGSRVCCHCWSALAAFGRVFSVASLENDEIVVFWLFVAARLLLVATTVATSSVVFVLDILYGTPSRKTVSISPISKQHRCQNAHSHVRATLWFAAF